MVFLAFVGGVVLPVVYVLSKPKRFECANCQNWFYAHTATTRFFSILWYLLIAIAVAGIVYAIFSHGNS